MKERIKDKKTRRMVKDRRRDLKRKEEKRQNDQSLRIPSLTSNIADASGAVSLRDKQYTTHNPYL